MLLQEHLLPVIVNKLTSKTSAVTPARERDGCAFVAPAVALALGASRAGSFSGATTGMPYLHCSSKKIMGLLKD